ncbi:hypothetical protein [Actinoplanes sp. NPDC048796]
MAERVIVIDHGRIIADDAAGNPLSYVVRGERSLFNGEATSGRRASSAA